MLNALPHVNYSKIYDFCVTKDMLLLMQVYSRLKFFVEDQIYWAPASTTSDLYSQLALKKYREIPMKQIK